MVKAISRVQPFKIGCSAIVHNWLFLPNIPHTDNYQELLNLRLEIETASKSPIKGIYKV